ncbi:MAG: hypothetical protein PHE18_03840 [Candidatus Omnitrophica bacterium]|nr:hypothetical protein [Candidatus Omnitrophota bacterium]MDD5552989.1 hypothetical protein [Candidatus Omnitrophota bacterium]
MKAARNQALTLTEILVASLIMSLVTLGLSGVFLAGRKHLLGTRTRVQSVELGRFFLAPLQMDVRQDLWGSNCLSAGSGCPGAQEIDGMTFTPTYERTPGFAATSLIKVRLRISWTEQPAV